MRCSFEYPGAAAPWAHPGVSVAPMLGRPRWAALSIALAGALVATGCGGGGDGDAASGDKAESSSERPDGRKATPLETYFESVGLSEDSPSDDEIREQERRVEQKIVDCMREQGFDYTPMEAPDPASVDDFDEGPWSLPPDEFAERYGYGMFTIDESELPGMDDEAEDPNQAALDEMSEAERVAYEEALYGKFDDTTGEILTEGCSGEAYAAEFGDSAASEDEFAGLFEEMDALWTRIDDDPRVAEATRDWADCMADAGYPGVSTPEDASNLVQQRFDELVPGDATSGESLEGADGEAVTVSGDPAELDPDDRRALRDYEIAVAMADFECQDGDGKYADVYYEVQVELEQQFIDENRDELDRYRESLASSGSA
jgi:hypothetical protein